MSGSDTTTPKPSEKDRLRAQYNNNENNNSSASPEHRGHSLSPNSFTLGSPISPLNNQADAFEFNRSPALPNRSVSRHQANIPIVDDHNVTPTQQPPPYSGPSDNHSANARQREVSRRYPGLPPLNYALYCPPTFTLSQDNTTLKTTDPIHSETPQALAALLFTQASLPPKPTINITGHRPQYPSDSPDFALKLNLLPLLVPASDSNDQQSGNMSYLRLDSLPADPSPANRTKKPLATTTTPTLEAWISRFLADPHPGTKEFILERRTTHLDTSYLEGQIRALIAGTGYTGVVTIALSLTHARVVIQRKPAGQTGGGFFSGLASFFSGKQTYRAVTAVWPFASCARGEEGVGAERVCAVQSEEEWWREWAAPIRLAVVERRRGWVTSEDRLEALMEGKGKGLGKVDWGI